jgi:hypothetical protein
MPLRYHRGDNHVSSNAAYARTSIVCLARHPVRALHRCDFGYTVQPFPHRPANNERITMQIFRPGADLLLRLTVVGLLLAVGTVALVWHLTTPYQVPIREPIEQEVPFSHQHHVAEDGIDCRYCHTSVEVSSFAGIPPTYTCMTCHSQLFTSSPILAPVRNSLARDEPLRWKRVNKLPDFVYFDHGIHVSKGVGCVSCHGRVDRMNLTYRAAPLTMQWCLACHRAPERYLRPLDRVFDLDWQPPENQLALGRKLLVRYHIQTDRLTDCSVCHR